MSRLTPANVLEAARRLEGFVPPTPLERSHPLSALCGAEIYLKLDCAQITGSFKIRGASNTIGMLDAASRARGVTAASAGNHAIAVVAAASRLEVRASVFVPGNASAAKIAALQQAGADVRVVGAVYADAEAAALRFAAETGAHFISPYSGLPLMAGQATIALETLRVLPQTDLLLVPVGGGGLASGVAVWAKSVNPGIRVIGVQSEASCVIYHSLRAGRIVNDVPELPSLADGLAGSVDEATLTFSYLQNLLDGMLLVTEQEIAQAMIFLMDEHHLIVEGSGAVGIAALLGERVPALAGRTAVALLTGRNVSSDVLLGLRQ